jgi:hypothetical protein
MVAIIIVAFMLFQQSNTNKKELDQQAIRNMELIKGNFQVAFQSFTNQKLQEERRRILNRAPNSKFKKFEDFDFLKVGSIELVQEKEQEIPALILNISSLKKDTISLDQLFAKINNQDFFKPVFLTDLSGKILYPRSEIGKSFHSFDEAEVDSILLPTNKKEIIYHDEEHLIYYTPVILGDYKFYLVGAIKRTDFESIGWKVDFTNLTILVFLLGLMLFSLPIFSFFGLTKGDKLTRFGVFSVGLSLVGILVIVGFGFSFFKNHHPITDTYHEIIRKEIKDSIQKNLKSKIAHLNQWDTTATILSIDGNLSSANELIKIDHIGAITEFYDKGEKDRSNQIFRSLRHREYLRYFLEKYKAEENKHFDSLKSDDYYIGSHYSLANSKQESVISKLNKDLNQVKAITFFWKDSLTKFDKNREFLLFKENGLLIHKSQRIKIAADSLQQLLSKSKWEEIEGIMKSNNHLSSKFEWEIPLYLDGHAYTGYLMMVSYEDSLEYGQKNSLKFDQPLWMLYLKDEHLEHVYSSLVTFETTLLLLFYLLMLALISLANKLNKSKSKNKTLEKFAYNYLYPKKSKAKNFEYLIWFMVIYIFIILYFYHLPYIHFFGIFAILVIATFHFKVITFMMLGPSWQKSNSQLSAEKNRKIIKNSRNQEISRFFWIMGVVIAISFGLLFGLIPHIQYSILFIWVVVSSYYSFHKRLKILEKKNEKIRPVDETDTETQRSQHSNVTIFHYTYTSFFIMWIFMIGFVPGYIIYSKVHQFESKNWEPQKNLEDFENTPDDFWRIYDEGRRLFFGSLTNQNASQVKEFIYTDRRLLQPKLAHLKLIDTESLIKPFKKLKESILWSVSVTLFFLLILGLFIWMVYTLTKKIYFLDFEGFLYHHQNPNTSTLNQKVFLCGLDSENFPKWIQDLIDLGKHEVTDCTSNPELKWGESTVPNLKGKNIWVIKNVHCLPDLSLLLERLPHFINALNGNIYLVISSGVSWKQLLYQIKDPKQNMIFSQLFSSFHFEYVPIELDPNLKVVTPNDEKASILIRSRKAYFYNIWSEMSFDEKKICYYFSQEGFFNFNNKPVITELIQKGILVPRGILDGSESTELFPILFDKHFRIFILNNVTEEEIQAFKRDEEKHGNASSIQIAVFSFILLSVALISYFDKNFLDQASTFVAGITGALGGIYSLIRNSLPSVGKNKS